MAFDLENLKKIHYNNSKVADKYSSRRFKSIGGAYVNHRELTEIEKLISNFSKDISILDVPCGQGRLLNRLEELEFTSIVGIDSSPKMLERVIKNKDTTKVELGDCFNLRFENNSFDLLISLRFMFHTQSLTELLREFNRVLKIGGTLIFDSLSWSPKSSLFGKLIPNKHKTYTYSKDLIFKKLKEEGFDIVTLSEMFIFPTGILQVIQSKSMVTMIDKLENNYQLIPKSKQIYMCIKIK